MTKRIWLHKLHRPLLIDKSVLNWNWEKEEDMISWEWDFLEVLSIREIGGREFVGKSFGFDLHVKRVRLGS